MKNLEKILTWSASSFWLDYLSNYERVKYYHNDTSEEELFEIYHRVGELARELNEEYPFEHNQSWNSNEYKGNYTYKTYSRVFKMEDFSKVMVQDPTYLERLRCSQQYFRSDEKYFAIQEHRVVSCDQPEFLDDSCKTSYFISQHPKEFLDLFEKHYIRKIVTEELINADLETLRKYFEMFKDKGLEYDRV